MAKAKAINVKVSTVKIIQALEASLARIKQEYLVQDSKELEYQASYENWKKELFQYALAMVEKAYNIRTNYRSWNTLLNIDFDIPLDGKDIKQEPQRDFTVKPDWSYKQEVEEIENAIRILKMTDEETVSTSTFNSISQYL